MKKISDIISNPIISLFEGKYEGHIYNILFDNKKKQCKYFCILNEEDNINKIIKVNDIYSMDNDCIFIKNSSCIELNCNFHPLLDQFSPLINLDCYTLTGKFVGKSIDAIINEQFCLESIILNSNQTISRDQIFNISNEILLFSNDSNININKFKPKTKIIKNRNSTNTKVSILSPDKLQENLSNEKFITDYRFLLGRKVTRTISSINGEIIIKSGNPITKDIIRKASMLGKLIEVARYSEK